MKRQSPAVGSRLDEIETPALIVDLDRLEANIRALAEKVASGPAGVSLRPHVKTHKSADIAKLQIAAGACGVCCQTVGEGEVMVEAGISDIFLSNEIVGPNATRRLAQLALRANICACVDDVRQIDDLATAADDMSVRLDVRVEIDVGARRCGVLPGDDAVSLAHYVKSKANLRFAGLQAYHGPAQHFRDPHERAAAIADAAGLARKTQQALQAAGLECPVIAGAGTGSFECEQHSAIYTELQCGSYIFMDADYAKNQGLRPFQHSLFVISTVISSRGAHAVCDAGLKAVSVDSGLPQIHGNDAVTYCKASDEHGTLQVTSGSLAVGERLVLIPGHCDPTVNLYDHLIGFRNGFVETIWPIARGH